MTYPISIVKQAEVKINAHKNMKRMENISVAFPTDIARILHNFETSECDFDITFNANRNWYFGNGTISSEQADFKVVAAKQITHGLGFMSNLIRTDDGLVVPNTYYDNDPNTKYLRYMSPLDNLSSYKDAEVLIIQSFNPVSAVFNLFKRTGLYSKNWNTYNMTRTELMWYKWAGSKIPVRGEGYAWVKGCKALRLLDAYSGESSMPANFYVSLMTEKASLMTGNKLTDMMQRMHGLLYSCDALSVLREVGYATYMNPTVIQFASEHDFHRQ